MKTYSEYIDLYGRNGWKSTGGGIHAALAVMARDEIANPGTTDLSKFDRNFLLKLNTASDYKLGNASDAYKLYVSFPASAPPDTTDYNKLSLDEGNIVRDPYEKQYAEITFLHGGINDPFTHYIDTLTNDGALIKDYVGIVDVDLIRGCYEGLSGFVTMGFLFAERIATNDHLIVSSTDIFATTLARAIEHGIATVAEVQAKFGDYEPLVVAEALANHKGENSSVALPRLAALDDANATAAFKAYLAYFGRPPDTGGLTSWVTANNSTDSLIESFGNSAESNALYSNSSSGDRVDAIYHYLFNRVPEAEGRAFWANAIDHGILSMAGAALNILNGARLDDLTMINQKVAAAQSFVEGLDTPYEISLYVGGVAALNARKYLSTITIDDAHNTQVVALVGQVINLLGTGVEPLFSQHGIALGYY